MGDNLYKKIDIYDNDWTVITSVKNISVNEDKLILSGFDFPLIPHHTVVNAMGYTDEGVVAMQGEITMSTEKQINLDILDFAGKEERRAYLKVRTNIKTVLLKSYSIGRGNRAINREEEVCLRDISVGGIGFYSNTNLLKNQKILIALDAIQPGLAHKAIVLRRNTSKAEGEFKYRYGCRFLRLSHEQERVVCAYVFKVQIENHKKTMEENDIQ